MALDDKIKLRFFKYVDKKQSNGCWTWVGAKTNGGYGSFRVDKSVMKAHRVSWIIHNGNIPENKDHYHGMVICHSCDNPMCVNPDHLFIGTQADNVKDRENKNRGVHKQNSPFVNGERNPMSKITMDIAKTIRHLYFAERRTQKEIGQFYKLDQSSVSDICTNKHWKGVCFGA